MKRLFDVILALVLIVLFSIPMLVIVVLIKLMQNRGQKLGDASIFLALSFEKIETSPICFICIRAS